MKISTISDIFELENIGYISPIYIMDKYRANPGRGPGKALGKFGFGAF